MRMLSGSVEGWLSQARDDDLSLRSNLHAGVAADQKFLWRPSPLPIGPVQQCDVCGFIRRRSSQKPFMLRWTMRELRCESIYARLAPWMMLQKPHGLSKSRKGSGGRQYRNISGNVFAR